MFHGWGNGFSMYISRLCNLYLFSWMELRKC
jgi:hypothetical protein